MNSKYFIWLPILIGFALLTSCEESEIPVPISDAPTVTIMSPTSSDSPFASGTSILLQIQFDDDEELHEMLVTIIRLHDGAMVYQQNLHHHGDSYRWVDNLTLTSTEDSDFEIRASVTDHELQRTDATETFRMIL